MILNRGADQPKPVQLAEISNTGSYIVDNVSGPEVQRLRLSELGIVSGTRVSVLPCNHAGMRVVKIGESRMALSPGTTEHIWLQPKAF